MGAATRGGQGRACPVPPAPIPAVSTPPHCASCYALRPAPQPPFQLTAVDTEVRRARLLRGRHLAPKAGGGGLLGQPLHIDGRVLALDDHQGHGRGRVGDGRAREPLRVGVRGRVSVFSSPPPLTTRVTGEGALAVAERVDPPQMGGVWGHVGAGMWQRD
jgi:hypothetical protein